MADSAIHILSLCSGSGMLDEGVRFALQAIGVQSRVVGYVERDASAAGMLLAGMERETFQAAPVWCGDVRDFDAAPWRGAVDILTGGYPCQPFSRAGRRLGSKDPRHIWPAIRRICARVEPSLVFFENVDGHVSQGLFKVLRDLDRIGYRIAAGVFSAKETGAPHLRKRIFVCGGLGEPYRIGPAGKPGGCSQADKGRAQSGERSKRLANYSSQRLQVDSQQDGGEIERTVDASRRSDARGCDPRLGESDSSGLSHSECEDVRGKRRGSEGGATAEPSCTPLYPPGRNDYRRWADLLAAGLDPSCMPATESGISMVADGVVPSSDLLRIGGNGVVPVCAGLAFLQLVCCLGFVETKEHQSLDMVVQQLLPGMEWEVVA